MGVKTHFKGTPIHNSYAGAKQRCNYQPHKSFKNYGGRGIKFLWKSFNEFYNDMSKTWFPGGTLDRINNDGHYCKSNCQWVNRYVQARHTRKSIHSELSVSQIREWYAIGLYNQNELAILFNDSQGNISNIITHRTWKNLI